MRVVAYDGTAGGLLPDGRTLLLAQSIYTGDGFRKHTSFTFVDVRKMKRLGTITMPGPFAFDAVSLPVRATPSHPRKVPKKGNIQPVRVKAKPSTASMPE